MAATTFTAQQRAQHKVSVKYTVDLFNASLSKIAQDRIDFEGQLTNSEQILVLTALTNALVAYEGIVHLIPLLRYHALTLQRLISAFVRLDGDQIQLEERVQRAHDRFRVSRPLQDDPASLLLHLLTIDASFAAIIFVTKRSVLDGTHAVIKRLFRSKLMFIAHLAHIVADRWDSVGERRAICYPLWHEVVFRQEQVLKDVFHPARQEKSFALGMLRQLTSFLDYHIHFVLHSTKVLSSSPPLNPSKANPFDWWEVVYLNEFDHSEYEE